MKTILFPILLLASQPLASLAQAQTPLLKIDYQNATVFHVLDDGRLLLPTGAADGYVLTTDSDGYATWEAASGGGGLSVVSSDATLSGEGTSVNPLGVTVPLVLTSSNSGVIRGEYTNGNFGFLGGFGEGVYGESNIGDGVYGKSSSGRGVYGKSSSGRGVEGFSVSGRGVYGQSISSYGVYGLNGSKWGVLGSETYGVFGSGGGSGFAAGFSGDVIVLGNLIKSGGSFKIDHPLDPANKYLSHSFVESPDMMNVYNGNVITDANGEAIVILPDYFEALNRDFRYQLTVIGTFAQAIVAQEIQGNQFVIRTDQPEVKVSWQVTGIRQDAWAEQHRIVVEEDKPAEERGFYLHPTLFGHSQARGLMRALATEEPPAFPQIDTPRSPQRH